MLFEDWFKEDKNKAPKKKVSKKYPKIIYPLFEKLSNNTDDEFWKSKFYKAAHGKLPKGFKFTEEKLSYEKSNKIFIIRYNKSDDIDVTTNNFIEFFKQNEGVFSDHDLENKQITQIVPDFEWKEIKPKMKQNLIFDFVDRLAIKKELNPKQLQQLIDQVKILISLKIINDKNIKFKHNTVKKIRVLEYDDESKKFSINEEAYQKALNKYNSKKRAKKKEVTTKSLSQIWLECERLEII